MYLDTTLELLPNKKIALRIYREHRRGYRATVGKKQIIFRLPLGLPILEEERIIGQLKQWAIQTFKQKPAAFEHLLPKPIAPKAQLVVMDTPYRIEVEQVHSREVHMGKIDTTDTQLVKLELVAGIALDKSNQALQNLLSKIFVQRYLWDIQQRVLALNNQHFRCHINSVKLRLTQSRWGSCSNTGNINLSSRLLLAPAEVRDAVIVHELAHRIEMNHSNRFWKLVYDAVPNYDLHDQYLKDHSKKLQFWPEQL